LEQRPILLIKNNLVGRPELRLQGLLAMQYHLLNLDPAALETKILEIVLSSGEKSAIRILDFVLAGKVKKTKPELTWRNARSIAQKLARV
jgi:hypothetical protein